MTEIDDLFEELETSLRDVDSLTARARVLLDYRGAPNRDVVYTALNADQVDAEYRQLIADWRECRDRLTTLKEESGDFERASIERGRLALDDRFTQVVIQAERLLEELQSVAAQDLFDEIASEGEEKQEWTEAEELLREIEQTVELLGGVRARWDEIRSDTAQWSAIVSNRLARVNALLESPIAGWSREKDDRCRERIVAMNKRLHEISTANADSMAAWELLDGSEESS